MIVHKACFFHIFQSMCRTLDGFLQEEAVQNESVERTQAHVLSLNKDILSQEEKLKRASKQVWLPSHILLYLFRFSIKYCFQ